MPKKLVCLFLSLIPMVSCAQPAVLSKLSPARVMCVGDSITEGKFVLTGGYRKPLRDLLKSSDYSVVYVGKEDDGKPENRTGFSDGMDNPNHEGYGMMRIDEILNGGAREGHFSPVIGITLANYYPDVILMMLGTNDAIQNYKLSTIGDRMQKLLDTIFADEPAVSVVLAQITPMRDPKFEAAAQAYNALLPDIVAKEKALGHKIILVDMHSAIDPVKDSGDGVHPNQVGFNKMAAVWYEALTGEKAPELSK